MKLSSVLLLMTMLHVSAAELYSQTARLSLHVQQTTLPEILKQIENQSEFLFFYSNEDVDKNMKVNVDVSNQRVEEVLSNVLKNTGLVYTIKDRHILLISKKDIMDMAKQGITITGTVTDAAGEPMPGVNVVVKGTISGGVTDIDGKYTVTVPDQNAVLVFSFIGYVSDEIVVGSQRNINTTLQEDTKEIEEVVVIGYGSQKKSQMISSVSTIKAEEVNGRTVTMLTQAIAGLAPGVTSIQRSGQPGSSGTDIQIRGVGSFGASPAPLILIDGIPGSINTIDPNDVESITFLKDAASAAIYGARAANGVVLVTTKMGGRTGKVKVSYNGYVGIQTPTNLPEVVPSWEYAELMNEAVPGKYTAEQIQKFRDGSDPDHYANVDYIGQMFKSSLQTGHNVSLNGGGDVNQYMISFGALYQNGIIDKNDYTRYNARINMVTNIARQLKLTTRAWGRVSNDNQPAPPASMDYEDMLNFISNVVRTPSIYADKLSNGDWGGGVVGKGTPASMMACESFYKAKSSELGINLRLDWDVVDGLKLSAIGGYTQENDANRRFLATQRINSNLTLSPSSLNQESKLTSYQTLQFLAEYKKTFGKHDFDLLAGHSFESSSIENVTAKRLNFPSNDYPYMRLGDADTQTNGGTASEWALDSYFGRLQYNYAMKYLAEFSMRYDGSSRFPKDRKYAFFPSVAVGWRIGEEAFIRDNVSWINELKIKASWGILGNQSIQDVDGNQVYYPYQTVYSSGFNYPFGGTIATGLASSKLVDPDIHWESTETKDIGIEMSVLERTLSFSLTYFDKYTYDILTSPGGSVSKVLGKTVGDQNSGKLKNRGLEITLGYNNRVGDFRYSINGNFTYVHNEVRDLGVGNVEQANGLIGNGTIFIGHPMNVYYGYITDGLYTNDNDITEWTAKNNQTAVNPAPKPGDVRYADVSGDGVVDSKDLVVLGSRIPKYNFGLTLSGAYKGFDLNILLQGVTGVSGFLDTYAGFAFHQDGQIQTWQRDERWTTTNPNRYAKYPRLESLPSSGSNNTRMSDYWVLNGSYLRIKTVQLGYTVPKKFTDRLGIESVRFNLSGENLFTFSGYRKGWDPEKNGGSDYYPILRNFTFGINLAF